jgi:peptide/nickel transport system substrate-binding protein
MELTGKEPMVTLAPWDKTAPVLAGRYSRRRFLEGAAACGLSAWAPRLAVAAPTRGGNLVVGLLTEPDVLTSAITSSGPAQSVSTKIFDGLLSYDFDDNPKPQLATAWSISPDGLEIRFDLRPNVLWHDGTPFTADDVAFSVLEVWKKFHSRGRSTFANVIAAETSSPLVVVWKLSKPAPYILSALGAQESQVIPKHLYDGRDILTNPANTHPVGTGPFRFAAWERGNYIALERNPRYWDAPKPYFDRVILRILPDAASGAAALEAGEVEFAWANALPLSDMDRLSHVPTLKVDHENDGASFTFTGLIFNLDRPVFRDVRVRRAIAHALDRDFILKNIFYGLGQIATGPIPPTMHAFYDGDVTTYAYDPAKAAALLDEAGLKPDGDGVRLTIMHDPLAVGDAYVRIAEYFRDALGKIGIRVKLRTQDFGAFIRRVYTERDFDVASYGGQAGPDPAIGTQRLYWSKNFAPGVPFSNGAHYSNPEVDRLLEAAQTELDPARRRALYGAFQKQVATDVPIIPLIAPTNPLVVARRLMQYRNTFEGVYSNFSDAYFG